MMKKIPGTFKSTCCHCGNTNSVILFVPENAVFYQGDLVCPNCSRIYFGTISVVEKKPMGLDSSGAKG